MKYFTVDEVKRGRLMGAMDEVTEEIYEEHASSWRKQLDAYQARKNEILDKLPKSVNLFLNRIFVHNTWIDQNTYFDSEYKAPLL